MDLITLEINFLYPLSWVVLATSSIYLWFKIQTKATLLLMVGLCMFSIGSALSSYSAPTSMVVEGGSTVAYFDFGLGWSLGRISVWLGLLITSAGIWSHART